MTIRPSKIGDVRIGISGWRYPPWRGTFYPPKMPQRQELHFASRQVRSIEINGSFYSTQTPKSYKNWFAQTPDDFKFSVKCPRYITHLRRLKDCQEPLANFFASGVLHLQQKLGAFLWQLPPSFRFDEDRLENFFRLLPRTVAEAARLAKQADRVVPDFPESAAKSQSHLRHAIEIRHHSFENPDFIALLRHCRIALVFADTAGKWPYMEDVTADFLYLRLHGEIEIYSSGYAEESLRFWAKRIAKWRAGSEIREALTMTDDSPPVFPRDVFVYFDNDVKVRAPVDARRLEQIIGGAQ